MTQLDFSFASRNHCLVNRFYGAYVSLSLAPEDESGDRMVSIARFGVFDVRLTELADRPKTGSADFWIELYQHDAQSTLDSYRCQDLDEGEVVTKRLISEAKRLHEIFSKSFRA